jgi:LysR family transcriptional activator of nhaA
MSRLNYHHLYYFWHVVKQGNLTQAANNLHVSQSALSLQIKQLEHALNVTLFTRTGRSLVLTDVGRQTFSYAEEIFKKGEELESLLTLGIQPEQAVIRIGMLSTMSRNFIESFIAPILHKPNIKYIVYARGQTNLLNALADHQLDLALTNIEVRGTNKQIWQCQLLARQPIAIIGPPGLGLEGEISAQYQHQRWVLPVNESPIRSAFDGFCAQYQLKPHIVAEADDMAMLRLLARDTGALAVMPRVVVKDELERGELWEYLVLPNIFENFYAVSVKRHITNPQITELLNIKLAERQDASMD